MTTEDSYRIEQERYRSLTSDYESVRNELVHLKRCYNKEKNDNHEVCKEQQDQLEYLSKSIISKRNKHNKLLIVYISFFLCCYLLIFFLFFFLLSW